MSEVIASLQNSLIKKLASLQQKKYRDEFGLFIAEGIRAVEELVAAEWELEFCLYTESVGQHPRILALLPQLAEKGCRLIETTSTILSKVADTEQPQGILAAVRKKTWRISEVMKKAKRPALWAVLDTIQDPGNVGTIIRTADAAGCTGVIMTKGCADLFSGKTVRATMGSLFHLPVVEGVASFEVISVCKELGVELLAASLEASSNYLALNYQQDIAVIFGNEGNGISDALLSSADQRLHIPLYGKAESLNVAAAAAIVLYEAARQRRI